MTLAGDLEEQQELMSEMILILVIAIFLVYLLMTVQFNHLAHSLIVMSVIPMTIVGAILGLFLTQRELSIMSGIGIVMLIGIVLNNAILLIYRTNQLWRKGYPVGEALIEAGKNRIRPIFMTTLTTAGGMLPLALASALLVIIKHQWQQLLYQGFFSQHLLHLCLYQQFIGCLLHLGKEPSCQENLKIIS
jgi:multidrug efflux pump subunit AcrB